MHFIFLLLSSKISEDLLSLTHLLLLPDHHENVFLTFLPSCKCLLYWKCLPAQTPPFTSFQVHCSFNFKTQWGKLQWSGSLAGATDRITAFCLCIVGDEWGQSSGQNLEMQSEIGLQIYYGLSSLEVV